MTIALNAHSAVDPRWADKPEIAVAAMSATGSFGLGWENALTGAHGVEPDRARLDYYRLLGNET